MGKWRKEFTVVTPSVRVLSFFFTTFESFLTGKRGEPRRRLRSLSRSRPRSRSRSRARSRTGRRRVLAVTITDLKRSRPR